MANERGGRLPHIFIKDTATTDRYTRPARGYDAKFGCRIGVAEVTRNTFWLLALKQISTLQSWKNSYVYWHWYSMMQYWRTQSCVNMKCKHPRKAIVTCDLLVSKFVATDYRETMLTMNTVFQCELLVIGPYKFTILTWSIGIFSHFNYSSPMEQYKRC